MQAKHLGKRLLSLFGAKWRYEHAADLRPKGRGALTHVVIVDGTLSTLDDGHETNAGLAFKLLKTAPSELSLYYEAGVQWRDWSGVLDVIMGRGINRQIRRAYGYLASRYRPGDRIVLLGYSRGAFAVRSLAGVIDALGLVRPEHANVRNIRTLYRHYQNNPNSRFAREFREHYCHSKVDIHMVGVWDTVKALGLRLPLLWMLTERQHGFHSHRLGLSVKAGYHALALDERRVVYEPVLWECPINWPHPIEQVWFSGTHGDVGGQLGEHPQSRPLGNIPLVWMLQKLENHGIDLPENWRQDFPQDASAPSMGSWHSWAELFLLRRDRVIGRDHTERLHPTVTREVPELAGRAVSSDPLPKAQTPKPSPQP